MVKNNDEIHNEIHDGIIQRDLYFLSSIAFLFFWTTLCIKMPKIAALILYYMVIHIIPFIILIFVFI